MMFTLIAIVTTIVVGIVAFLKWKLQYWSKVGLSTLNPELLFGDARDLLLGKASFGEKGQQFYKEIKSKNLRHAGVYISLEPFYVPVDPEIVKHIIQVDFQHFVNHGVYVDEENDPLSGNLFNLEDSKWRHMRIKLTPTFTSGKMKMMFQTLADCSVGLKSVMDESVENNSAVDIKDVLARFTTDIIGSVAFGLECNSLKDPNTVFRKYGKKIFDVTYKDMFKGFLQFTFPSKFLKAIKFKVTKSDVEEFFLNVIRDTVNYREKNNVYRKDFMQLLIQLKNEGFVPDDEETTDENVDYSDVPKGLTINELAAQAFVFFVGGFETSSTTMTFALYELATNPHIQEKLREEINRVLKKHDDQLTYYAIKDMVYMDQVINETLRKYPPLPILIRRCTKDYTIPNTNIVIEKGTGVLIPNLGLQMDPEYFPNPEVFDPDRFSEENKNSRPACTWLPFGDGPRICIGLRFGMMQTKVGLTTLLKNYKITLNKKTKQPLTILKTSFITAVDGGVWIDAQKL